MAIPVPYRSRMLSHLDAGQTLIVKGSVPPDATRFSVNLLSGTSVIDEHVGNVPLHVNVRFDEGKIVLNSMQTGQWGKEERHSNPFKKGEPFDLRVRAHDDKFEVSANQKEIAEYKYRLPLSSIDHIFIDGTATLNAVHWGGRYFKLPYETGFQNGHLASGQRVFVYGTPTGHRFSINFIGSNGDALFHFDVRFGEKAVVRNSQQNGVWGNEEREGEFPFHKNRGFDLMIVDEPYSIQIYVDNQRFCTFAHRIEPGQYVGIKIDGDLELTGLEVS
jgi:hypothetical protein